MIKDNKIAKIVTSLCKDLNHSQKIKNTTRRQNAQFIKQKKITYWCYWRFRYFIHCGFRYL